MQVLASQKQIDAKYESALDTAVSSTPDPCSRPATCTCLLCSLSNASLGLPRSPCTAAHTAACVPQQKAWQRRAELAVQKGDDDLAREALRRRATYQVSAAITAFEAQLMLVQHREPHWPFLTWQAAVALQANADQMKKQVDAQKKATDQLVTNTRCDMVAP